MPTERVPDDNVKRDTQPRDGDRDAELAAHTRFGVAFLCLVLGSALLLVVASWIGDVPGAAGGPHPDIAEMQHGGSSADRGGVFLAVGALFGAGQIAFFGLCFALGMRRSDGLGSLRAPLLVGLVLYLGIWIALVISYGTYAADPAAAGRWAGLPIPTAVLLFGFWPFPVYFVGLYLRYFESNVMSEAALEAFRRKVEALGSPGSSGRPGDGR